MTGASYEELFSIFSPFGDLDEIQLLPNRSFSFIHLSQVDACEKAFENLHAKLILPQPHNQPDQVHFNDPDINLGKLFVKKLFKKLGFLLVFDQRIRTDLISNMSDFFVELLMSQSLQKPLND